MSVKARILCAIALTIILVSCGGSTEYSVQSPQPNATIIPADPLEFDVGVIRRVARFHDDEYGAVCWVYREGGISCIPDAQLEGDK
jgi:hypothetical protein